MTRTAEDDQKLEASRGHFTELGKVAEVLQFWEAHGSGAVTAGKRGSPC